MRIGYLTKFSRDEVQRAKRLGFDCLEIHAATWHNEVVYNSAAERQAILDDLKWMSQEQGLTLSCLAHYGPGLSLTGRAVSESYEKAIDLAAATGVGVLSTIVVRTDPQKTVADNIPAFKETFGPLLKLAGDKGVKIAVENWPAFRGYPWAGKAMAYSPQAWDLLFDAAGTETLGLEFDPSHLYWQGIDHIAALRKYKSRVYHVHAKDTEIFHDIRNHIGIFGTDGWWTYRIPGLGEIDWRPFINELHTIGYRGGVCIEHEDTRFAAWKKNEDPAKFEQGLRIGLATLRPLIG